MSTNFYIRNRKLHEAKVNHLLKTKDNLMSYVELGYFDKNTVNYMMSQIEDVVKEHIKCDIHLCKFINDKIIFQRYYGIYFKFESLKDVVGIINSNDNFVIVDEYDREYTVKEFENKCFEYSNHEWVSYEFC